MEPVGNNKLPSSPVANKFLSLVYFTHEEGIIVTQFPYQKPEHIEIILLLVYLLL